MADTIVEKYYKHVAKQAGKPWPQHANRCSSIGFPCVRKLVYDLVRRDALPDIDPGLQVIFNEGNRQELIIQRDLLDMGVEIIEQQSEVSFPQHRLFGHIDGMWVQSRVRRVVDFKTMSQYSFQGVQELSDFNKHYWHLAYIGQMNLYIYGKGVKRGFFLCKNKNTGELKQFDVELDMKIVKDCFKKCDYINVIVDEIKAMLLEQYQIHDIADFKQEDDFTDYLAIKNEIAQVIEDKLPERLNKDEICQYCPYRTICLPDEYREAHARVLIDTKLEAILDKRHPLKIVKKEFDTVDKQAKDIIKAANLDYFVCGNYEVKVKRGKKITVNIDPIE